MKKTENPKKKKGGKLTLVIIVIALAVMAFALFKIAQIYKDYHESEQTFEKLEETYVVNPDGSSVTEDDWNDDTRIQFDALKKENPDIMAWLRFDNFDDVHISYPVLYSGDDSKYLRSDIYGNYHIAGCIFLEGLNNPDFSDYHSIIYGHNMRNTTMFGDLKRYKNDEGFYEKNQFFNVYTVGYGADDSWQAMIDKMVASSMKDTGIHPTKDDKVVTLSTCSKAGETKRFVVHGVLVDVKTH